MCNDQSIVQQDISEFQKPSLSKRGQEQNLSYIIISYKSLLACSRLKIEG